STFGSAGKVFTVVDCFDAKAYKVSLQKDNKIVVIGSSQGYNYINHFTVARYNNDVTLPITLTNFTATKNKSSVLLNWQTASEQNNAYFSIERSNNGHNNFKEIGRVNSKGNSSQLQ